jgi:hypothetical protein
LTGKSDNGKPNAQVYLRSNFDRGDCAACGSRFCRGSPMQTEEWEKRALLTPLGRRNESASKMIMARFQFYTY